MSEETWCEVFNREFDQFCKRTDFEITPGKSMILVYEMKEFITKIEALNGIYFKDCKK